MRRKKPNKKTPTNRSYGLTLGILFFQISYGGVGGCLGIRLKSRLPIGLVIRYQLESLSIVEEVVSNVLDPVGSGKFWEWKLIYHASTNTSGVPVRCHWVVNFYTVDPDPEWYQSEKSEIYPCQIAIRIHSAGGWHEIRKIFWPLKFHCLPFLFRTCWCRRQSST